MSNVIDINRNRQPQGIPSGGQFAASTHSEDQEVVLGRHAAQPAQDIPETLLMGHVQSPTLTSDLAWEVERANESGVPGYNLESFVKAVPNLPRGEAEEAFLWAMDAQADGGDYKAICEEVAERDTRAHPGGAIAPDYTPPGGKLEAGYGNGSLTTGGMYTGWRDATNIAVDIRKELKAATAGNYLPKGLTYSVTTEKYSGGQSIRVQVRGITDADRQGEEMDRWGDPKDRPEAELLAARVKEITNAYNRSDIDGQSDYFNTIYYGQVDIESDRWREFREEEAAERKAKRDSKRA